MQALYDIAEMRRRLAEIDAEREPLVHLIRAAEAYEALAGRRAPVPQSSGSPAPPRPQHGKTVLAITEDVALEIVDATRAPATTRQVINVMFDRGLPLPNKNVVNVVSARLSNSDKLEGRRGLGWWPKGRPWPHEEPAMFTANLPEQPALQGEEE